MKIINLLKRNFKFTCLLSIFLFVSCNKEFLERTPTDFITEEEVFSNIENAEAFLNNAYNSLPNFQENSDHGGLYNLGGGTDEMFFHGNAPQTPYDFNTGNWNPTSFPLQNRWADYYRVIRRLNMFIENFEQIPEEVSGAGGSNSERKKMLEGEAYGLRAFYYFQLFKMWGGVPIIDKVLDPNSGENILLERNAPQEVFNFIRSDIEKATAILPARYQDESRYGRITGTACRALLSRLTLYFASALWNPSNERGRWEEAKEAAVDAIEFTTTNGYSLSIGMANGNEAYERIFLEANNSEVIWARQDPGNERWNMGYYHLPFSSNGWYTNGILQEMVDSYEMSNGEVPVIGYDEDGQIVNPSSAYDSDEPYINRDPRFYQTVLYHSASWQGRTIDISPGGAESQSFGTVRVNYWSRKYIPESGNWFTGTGNTLRRWILFRMSELNLNYAEAQNELNGPDGSVYSAINEIRNRAGMPDLPADLSQAEMRERIRHERKIELAFEGQRFWDVRRWKIAEIVDDGNVHKVIVDENDNFSYPIIQTRVFDENKHYLFPIPQAEVDKNPNLEQNPGW